MRFIWLVVALSVLLVGCAEGTPASVPQPLTTQESLHQALVKALGTGNRKGVGRVKSVSIDEHKSYAIYSVYGREEKAGRVIEVGWAIDQKLTSGLVKSSARSDIKEMLKTINNLNLNYDAIVVHGTFELIDIYGRFEEREVVRATYTRETIDKINWDNFLTSNIYRVAGSKSIHSAFED